MIRDSVEELLDCYFKACSILIDYRDLARIASVFAHHGMNPHIGEQLFPLNLPDMSMQLPHRYFYRKNICYVVYRQLGEITQRAYFSILEGESIGSVRFAYERATDEYWKEHMWDD